MKCKKLIFTKLLLLIFVVPLSNCKNINKEKFKASIEPVSCIVNSESDQTYAFENGSFKAYNSKFPAQIDGCNKDVIWRKSLWYDMNYLWMGNKVDSTDYYGRFKLSWNSEYLYILVEVKDDILNPTLGNGIENYWKGDYVEVFIDEDKSGGDHKFNHQAFAYHVSTEGHAIDKNTLQETVFFDDHIEVARSKQGNMYIWEMAIKIFDEDSTNNIPVKIVAHKSIGFSIAYGDNDGNNSRKNFMGSKRYHGNNNDDGYINSDVFGSILFLN